MQVAFGLKCRWWDNARNVYRVAPGMPPVCPHCLQPVGIVDSTAWEAAMREHLDARSLRFLRRLRGKCIRNEMQMEVAKGLFATKERLGL